MLYSMKNTEATAVPRVVDAHGLLLMRTSKSASALFLVKEANPMLQRMEAVVLFYSSSDLGPGTTALVEHGFEVEVLDYTHDYGPAIWKPRLRAGSTCTAFLIGCRALSSNCTAMLSRPVFPTRRRKLPDHTARAKDFAHGPA